MLTNDVKVKVFPVVSTTVDTTGHHNSLDYTVLIALSVKKAIICQVWLELSHWGNVLEKWWLRQCALNSLPKM